jgi:DNA modification methylase
MSNPKHQSARRIEILSGNALDLLGAISSESIDAVVCDPPYEIGFMGRAWDRSGIAYSVPLWTEVLRVLRPGGHVAAFGGTRTYHRMAVAIEDAGFEIRDQLGWAYGSGFPKSLDISKAIDKAAGAEREVVGRYRPPNGQEWNLANDEARSEVGAVGHSSRAASLAITAPATDAARAWQGWGTALKPAWEPICLARKPLSEKSVAANVLKWGTGALNIDGCRIETAEDLNGGAYAKATSTNGISGSMAGPLQNAIGKEFVQPQGRWPANIIHDGSDEVLAGFPETENGGQNATSGASVGMFGNRTTPLGGTPYAGDSGSAARFFYCAKAGKLDRLGSTHPTVKPIELMRWLVRLTTPPGGRVLDPFAGTGSTGIAAWIEGFAATLIELRPESVEDIERRFAYIRGLGRPRALELARPELDPVKRSGASGDGLPLFGGTGS